MQDPSITEQALIKEITSLKERIRQLEQSKSEPPRVVENLPDSKELFARLVNTISDPVIHTDLQGHILFVNDSVLRKGGYLRQEVEGQNMLQFMAPEDHDRLLQNISLLLEGQKRSNEYFLVTKDGRRLPFELQGDVLRNADGVPFGFVVVCRDITERKQTEQALREGEERYRKIAQCIPDLVWMMDLSGRFTYANSAVERTHGWTVEEYLKLSLWQLVTPGQAAADTAMIEAELKKAEDPSYDRNKIVRYESEELRKDGSTFWAENTASFLWSEAGKPVGIIGVTRDITERKQFQEKIRESEEKYRLLAENATDIIFTMDGNLRFTYISPSVERIRGYTPSEAMKQSAAEALTPSSLKVAVKYFKEEMKIEFEGCGDVHRKRILELEETCKDGSTIWLESTFSPLRDGQNRLTGFLGISRDITDRKKLEEKLHVMSNMDELTGLYNRRGFFALASQQLKIVNRTEKSCLLFFIDLDKLKWINDTLGHQEGDRAIVETACLLRGTFRTSDIIGRMGGDEFAVLAIDTDEDAPDLLTKRLQKFLDKANEGPARKYDLSLSVGMARYNAANPASLDDLIARADGLMYEEKKKKRRQD